MRDLRVDLSVLDKGSDVIREFNILHIIWEIQLC